MFEEILCCLDGSPLAEQILPYAAEEALRFGSRLTLLEVLTVPTHASMASAIGAPAETGTILEDTMHTEEAEARAYLLLLAQPLSQKGVSVDCVVLPPAPAGEAIVKHALCNSTGLICIATHGRSGFGRAVFGSVADHVLRESGLPILLIKPREAKAVECGPS